MKINGKILLKGLGLHSGKECGLLIEPCSSGEILIKSGDNELPISQLSTSGLNLGSDYIFPDSGSPAGSTKIRTCEHVLSALTGLEIFSGVRLTVSGGEMPAFDGCSEFLCGEIMKHSEELKAKPKALDITSPVEVRSDDCKRFVAAFPCNCLRVTYMVEYDFIGAQLFDYVATPENYLENIAPARTFAMESDINYLRSHGMALGGSLDNAILVGEKIQAKGGLRWPDEFVRHKILDLIGDLASLGRPLNAHIIACRAGHDLHLKFVKAVKDFNN